MNEKQQILMELGAALDRYLMKAMAGHRASWEMVGLLERSIREVRRA